MRRGDTLHLTSNILEQTDYTGMFVRSQELLYVSDFLNVAGEAGKTLTR